MNINEYVGESQITGHPLDTFIELDSNKIKINDSKFIF